MEEYQEKFLHTLVRSGGLKFYKKFILDKNGFELNSGRISPYYINIAESCRFGYYQSLIIDAYVKAIKKQIGFENFDHIHGPAYKGIQLSEVIKSYLWEKYRVNKTSGYDRKEIKNHGDPNEKIIINPPSTLDRVLIVDDVTTTGKTIIENVYKLTKYVSHFFQIKYALVGFDREEKSRFFGTKSDKILKKLGIVEKEKNPSEELRDMHISFHKIIGAKEAIKYLYENEIDGKKYVNDTILKGCKEYWNKYGY